MMPTTEKTSSCQEVRILKETPALRATCFTSLAGDSPSIIVARRRRLDDFPGSSRVRTPNAIKSDASQASFLVEISRDPSSPSFPLRHPLKSSILRGCATFYAFTLRGKCQRTVLNKYKKVTDWQWATYVPARRREGTALTGASWYADGVRRGGIAEQRASGLGYETILEIRDRIAEYQ